MSIIDYFRENTFEFISMTVVLLVLVAAPLISKFKAKKKIKQDKIDDAKELENEQLIKQERKECFEKHLNEAKFILQNVANDLKMEKPIINFKKADDKELELRGRIKKRPIRVYWSYWSSINTPEPNYIIIDIQCQNHTGKWLDLKGKKGGQKKGKFDASNDWIDTDELNIEFDDNVYIEGNQEAVNETVSILKSLPPKLLEQVTKAIENIPLTNVIHTDQLRIIFEGSILEIKEPQKTLSTAIKLFSNLADALDGGLSLKETDSEKAILSRRVNCPYCNTSFILGIERNCPNCGGNYDKKV